MLNTSAGGHERRTRSALPYTVVNDISGDLDSADRTRHDISNIQIEAHRLKKDKPSPYFYGRQLNFLYMSILKNCMCLKNIKSFPSDVLKHNNNSLLVFVNIIIFLRLVPLRVSFCYLNQTGLRVSSGISLDHKN